MLLLVLTAFAGGCGSSDIPTAPTPGVTTTPQPQGTPTQRSARYRLTFTSSWSAATHPNDFPSTAHFSALVGATHDASATFWREGASATRGIQDMAERGRTSPLDQEVEAAIRAGTADRVWIGGGIDSTPGSVSIEFDISDRYPLVTFVSMIAPSPDWFVGVAGLQLMQGGEWSAERRIDLVPWDAGTDSGVTFTSPDRETQPRSVISRILAAPLSPGGSVTPLGTFTFTRLP
jgi:hypothetical protein